MQKVTKRLFTTAAFCAAALTAGAVQAQDITLAVMPAGMDTFGSAVGRGFSESAEELGFRAIVVDSQWSAERMSNNIDDLLVQNVDGIAILPIDSIAAMSWVDKLVEAGVPVVAGGSPVGDPEVVGQIGVYPGLRAFVNVDEIKTAAKIGALAAAGNDGSELLVAVVEGPAGYAVNDYRREGFLKGIADAGVSYRVVAQQPTNWSPEDGEAVCQNILTANPDVDVIFATADPMAVGCAHSVQAMGAAAKVMASAGGMQIGIEEIKAGAMAATTCYKPETMGRMIAEVLYESVTNADSYQGEFVAYEAPVVTADMLDVCQAEW